MPQLQGVKLNQLGQSLLETVVLIGLALVIVTGLTVVTVNGLKNSQFSQNQAQATRLAQEGIDCIRSIRDKNLPVVISGTSYYWYDRETFTNQIWSLPMANTNFIITPANGCTGLQNTVVNGPDTSLGTAFSSTFIRTISIIDYGSSTQKRVTVNVAWTDISGTHQSNIATILSQY